MLKATLMATAAAGALLAASAFTPAAAQHPNWDWNNAQQTPTGNPNFSSGPRGGYYYNQGYYGYGPGYDPTPAPYYNSGPSFYIGVGPGYGPRHYHW